MEHILDAIENIKKINPKRLVLISTVDVFENPVGADEDTPVESSRFNAYGCDRYFLERWVNENIDNYHIERLPGLFGKNIKKNFIFDVINITPSALSEAKFIELSKKEPRLFDYYILQDNGFYKLVSQGKDLSALKNIFKRLDFSAISFTDSRSVFQFYNLKYLWEHTLAAIDNNINILHLATEPVGAEEIYYVIRREVFKNELDRQIPLYDFRTKYADLFNGNNQYIFDKQKVLSEIKDFVASESGR
jgi:hypothetical protein